MHLLGIYANADMYTMCIASMRVQKQQSSSANLVAAVLKVDQHLLLRLEIVFDFVELDIELAELINVGLILLCHLFD